MHRLPGAERFEEGHHLPLIVHRPARDDALAMGAVHDSGLEGRAFPEFQRLRRLHVVMAVIEKVRRVGAFGFAMGQENGMPRRRVKLSREAQRPELVPEPGASACHLAVSRIGRNRWDAQELDIPRNSRAEVDPRFAPERAPASSCLAPNKKKLSPASLVSVPVSTSRLEARERPETSAAEMCFRSSLFPLGRRHRMRGSFASRRLSRRLRLHAAKIGVLARRAAARRGNRGAALGLIFVHSELAHRRLAVQEVAHLLARQGFVFEQPLRDRVQLVDGALSEFCAPLPRRRSIRRRISLSISCAVSGDMFCARETEWPRNTSSWLSR